MEYASFFIYIPCRGMCFKSLAPWPVSKNLIATIFRSGKLCKLNLSSDTYDSSLSLHDRVSKAVCNPQNFPTCAVSSMAKPCCVRSLRVLRLKIGSESPDAMIHCPPLVRDPPFPRFSVILTRRR